MAAGNGLCQYIEPVANILLIKLFLHRICCLIREPKVFGTPISTLTFKLYFNFHNFILLSLNSIIVLFLFISLSKSFTFSRTNAVSLLSVANLKSIPKKRSLAHLSIYCLTASLLKADNAPEQQVRDEKEFSIPFRILY